ncbi:hypothetical protein L1049_021696 [Liquidambar formosana]|uniref:protein-serine/threonine phosphatase n=1 Tax=Liquidambar formosana TaxID=63359 RepID=A0AAP0WNA0_LIQFO
MSDSGKVDWPRLEIASNARGRRLEVRRMKSIRPTGDFNDGINPHFITGGYMKKIRRVITEVNSGESKTAVGKESEIDDGKLLADPSPPSAPTSSERSSENEGTPVGVLVAGDEDGIADESRNLTCLSHGSISVIGRRRAMEDAVTVEPEVLAGELGSYDFFAVYDGHGGSRVAYACRDRLHQLLAAEVEGRTGGGGGGIEWEKVMAACFSKMDDEVNGGGDGAEDGSASVKTMGSTAVVVIVGKEELVVANCGDSRAVLCRGGVAVPLSVDHKPDRPDERERVEAAGGRVINWNGCPRPRSSCYLKINRRSLSQAVCDL